MKSFFVAALTNLRISGSLGRGLVLGPGYFLCNDPEHIKSLISADFPGLAGDLGENQGSGMPYCYFGKSRDATQILVFPLSRWPWSCWTRK